MNQFLYLKILKVKQALKNLCDITPVPKHDRHYFEIDAGSAEVNYVLFWVRVNCLTSLLRVHYQHGNFVLIDRLMMKKRNLLNELI